MEINHKNTDIIAFFVGQSQKELTYLKELVQSYRKFYSEKIIIMDMSRVAHKAAIDNETMWQQDRFFTTDITLSVDLEEIEKFFACSMSFCSRHRPNAFVTLLIIQRLPHRIQNNSTCSF